MKLIEIGGIPTSGKTTLVRRVREKLFEDGYQCHLDQTTMAFFLKKL